MKALNPAVALFFDRPYVDAQFCLREMVTQFLERGWEVDLYVEYSPTHPLPALESSRLHVFPFQKNRLEHGTLLFRLLSRSWGRCRCIVATPRWALYWAARVGQWLGIPIVCLSDEIDPPTKKWSAEEEKWRRREIWAHQRCALTVALSDGRFEVIKSENRLSGEHRHVILPNAPSGPAERLKSSSYRELLAIAPSKGILLHSGTFGWKLADRLVDEAANWSGNWMVVFQGRFKGALGERTKNANICFSPVVLPFEMLRYATSSADMGLALYSRDHDREKLSSESSAKLGLYLSCALPVICGNAESLRWVEKEGCGVWVGEVGEIPRAADRIRADYAHYSENAARVFSERFDYSKFFPEFLATLERLSTPRA